MPLPETTGEVRAEWVDFHGHMSASYFAVAFAKANLAAIADLGFAPDSQTASDYGVYVVEATYRYRAELRRADPYRIASRLGRVDDKRFQLLHRMTRPDGAPVAEAEILFLHVDKSGPRAATFPESTRARLAARAAEPASQE